MRNWTCGLPRPAFVQMLSLCTCLRLSDGQTDDVQRAQAQNHGAQPEVLHHISCPQGLGLVRCPAKTACGCPAAAAERLEPPAAGDALPAAAAVESPAAAGDAAAEEDALPGTAAAGPSAAVGTPAAGDAQPAAANPTGGHTSAGTIGPRPSRPKACGSTSTPCGGNHPRSSDYMCLTLINDCWCRCARAPACAARRGSSQHGGAHIRCRRITARTERG